MPYILNTEFTSRNTSDIESAEYDYKYPKGLDLRPKTKLHKDLVDEIMTRALHSATFISSRFDAWNTYDKSLTAYIDLTEKEKKVKDDDHRKPVSMVFPYSYTILETLMSYLTAAFFDDPIFRYEGSGPEDTVGAILMELLISHHCYKSKVILPLHTMMRDSLAYGFGVGVPGWQSITAKVARRRPVFNKLFEIFGQQVPDGFKKVTKEEVVFEGNDLSTIDPYKCLPDPNVSIVNIQHGEFFGWLEETNLFDLLTEEKNGDDLFNVKYLKHLQNRRTAIHKNNSKRSERSGLSGDKVTESNKARPVDLIHMYVKLIPKEMELGDSEYPEKWLFTIAADSVIIKARPAGFNHGKFPVCVAAPEFDGYTVTPVSRIEVLSGMQTALDFLLNAHIANVRKAVNDMLLVDPYLVNINDLRNPGPGKLIRMRRPAWGRGVENAVMQLGISDITRANVSDAGFLMEYMDKVAGTDSTMQGAVRKGGPERLTGQEFTGSRQGGMMRLERVAIMIATQAMQDIGEMFASHTQQLMSKDTYVKTIGDWERVLLEEFGKKAEQGRINVSPMDILVGYDTKIRTGQVPGLNYSQFWEKSFELLAKEPRLQQQFDIVRIFKHIARNNGVKNVDNFIVKNADMEQIEQQVQAGNMIPAGQAEGGMPV